MVRPMRLVTLAAGRWSTVEYRCNGSTESFHSISENFNEQEFRDERARVQLRAVADALASRPWRQRCSARWDSGRALNGGSG